MDINELYEELGNNFSLDNLKGELSLDGNCITWTYYLQPENDNDNNGDLFDDIIYEDESLDFKCESLNIEEQLSNMYDIDIQKIKQFLNKINEINNWMFSKADILDDYIFFRIF